MKQFYGSIGIPGAGMGSLNLWSYSPFTVGTWAVMYGMGFNFEFGETLKKFYNE